MKILKGKNLTKQIICIIIILMLCNFIIPNYSYAVNTEDGGSLLNTCAQFFCIIADNVIGFLQNQFTSPEKISTTTTKKVFHIKYSPGIIFAGEVPAFDIDFVGPEKAPKVVSEAALPPTEGGTEENSEEECWSELDIANYEDWLNHYAANYPGGDICSLIEQFIKEGTVYKDGSQLLFYGNDRMDTSYAERISREGGGSITLGDLINSFGITWTSNSSAQDMTLEPGNGGGPQTDLNYTYNYQGGKELHLKNVQYQGTEYEELIVIYSSISAEASDVDHAYFYEITGHYGKVYVTYSTEPNISNSAIGYTCDAHIKLERSDSDLYLGNDGAKTKEYKYISSILKPIIATWYRVFRRVALICLLSIIVYVGIRIVLKSTSAGDKAKYKKMLKDWLIALCMLFVLHYVMNIINLVINNINEVIKVSTIVTEGGNTLKEGEDTLMTYIRQQIEEPGEWGQVVAYLIIYNVLVVYTVIYTIQYIRRVIHIAFLTAIAPLIAITYPLDKIKDSKAQAFDRWLKEYIFFSLLQVIHLLLYYVFLDCAIDVTKTGNWLYGVVVIGFLTKAESIIKDMFGFNKKAPGIGELTAGATGALVMNAINKIPGIGKGKGKAASGAGGEDGDLSTEPSSIRTASPIRDPLEALRSNSVTQTSQQYVPEQRENSSQQVNAQMQGSMPQEPTTQNAPEMMGGNSQATSTHTQNSNQRTPVGSSMPNMNGSMPYMASINRNTQMQGNSPSSIRFARTTPVRQEHDIGRPKRNIWGGVSAVGKKYVPKALAASVKGASKVLLGGTGAIIGTAAGISQGSLGGAIGGAFAGAQMGSGAVDYIANRGEETISNIRKTKDEIQDARNEELYGSEVAENIRVGRDFRTTREYRRLKRTYGRDRKSKMFEKNLNAILESGVTDPRRIQKIFENNEKHPRKYSVEKGIAYDALAQKCSYKVLYDNKKFIRFCENRDLHFSAQELNNLRKCIIDFK